jgi:hypothetical protein
MYDDNLTRRRRKPKTRGPSIGLLIGLTLGIIFVICLGLTFIIVLSSRPNRRDTDTVAKESFVPSDTTDEHQSPKPKTGDSVPPVDPKRLMSEVFQPLSKRPPLPEGWVEFRHPKGVYSVYLPGKAHLIHSYSQNGPKKQQNSLYGGVFTSEETYSNKPTPDQPTLCGISIRTGPPSTLQPIINAMSYQGSPEVFPGTTCSITKINWSGKQAIEIVTECDSLGMLAAFPGSTQFMQALQQNGGEDNVSKKYKSYIRQLLLNDKLIAFELLSGKGSPSDTERTAFFESVVFGK